MASGNTRDFHRTTGWRSLRRTLLSGAALSLVLTCTTQVDGAAAQSTASQAGTATPDVSPAATTTPDNTHRATQKNAAPKTDSAEVVTVTAQRRVEKLQDVPISIQALSGTTLKRLNVENFDDLVSQLPNVTLGGFGPGQDNVYIRGLSVGGDQGGQGGGGVGSFPNVAIYLDDQSAQVPGHNLDIYAADLNRVEVLEGPQGTLFGSGAQAGVLRYITNKPNLETFSGTFDGGGAGTEHGAASGNADLTLNIPIIKDELAARVVVYDDNRGGYINNQAGTFARQPTDKGIHYAYYNTVAGKPQLEAPNATNSINNFSRAKDNINPVTYQGVRGELLWKFSDDWSALLSESAQRLSAEGVFYEEPYTSGAHPIKLAPLTVETFEPNSDKDTFENTALTINGRVGWLNIVYNGAYLIRNTQQIQDYTNYARGLYADYYQCQGANKTKGPGHAQCYSPGSTWIDSERDTHLSQEIRLSTPDTWRLRGIGGFYYEDFNVGDRTDFNYLTAPGFVPIAALPGTTLNDPSPPGPSTGFFNDLTRGYKQYAIFGSADYDIIPKVLTVTGGTRWFEFYNFQKGAKVSGFGCNTYYGYSGADPCTAGALNLASLNQQNRAYGFRSRANITYHATPDILFYYTWSQGYRPGGYDRTPPEEKSHGQVLFEASDEYGSDSLTNNEIGYKTQWFGHRLTIDGSFYQEDWTNVQDRLFDPGAFGNLAFTVNGPNFRVRGTEIQASTHPADGLTVSVNASLNTTKQLTSPGIQGVNGSGTLPNSVGIFGVVGDTLAQSPAFKTAFHARYEYPIEQYVTFVQFDLTHSSHTHSSVGGNLISVSPQFYQQNPIYNFFEAPITKLDISAGVRHGDWSVTAFCDNLTNERSPEFISAAQFVQSVIVDRPLTAGVKVSYSF